MAALIAVFFHGHYTYNKILADLPVSEPVIHIGSLEVCAQNNKNRASIKLFVVFLICTALNEVK
jgi:hypothetical protein